MSTPAGATSTYTYNVVDVIDPNTGVSMFNSVNVNAMKCNVLRASKIMDHPLENGSPVSDYAIVLPIQMEMGVFVNALARDGAYQLIAEMFESKTFLTVTTNADTYENMVIEAMPHDETPEMFGMLAIGVRLREVQLVTVQYQALQAQDVSDQTAQSTANVGEQQPSSSVAYDLGKTVGIF